MEKVASKFPHLFRQPGGSISQPEQELALPNHADQTELSVMHRQAAQSTANNVNNCDLISAPSATADHLNTTASTPTVSAPDLPQNNVHLNWVHIMENKCSASNQQSNAISSSTDHRRPDSPESVTVEDITEITEEGSYIPVQLPSVSGGGKGSTT